MGTPAWPGHQTWFGPGNALSALCADPQMQLQPSSMDSDVHGYWLNRWLASAPQETIGLTHGELAALMGNGTLAAPIEATYPVADYREAIDHASRNDRYGKVLFTVGQATFRARAAATT
jgi:NADPH:quinone reductase-like Zn-dependent oxidoreductase